MKISPQILLTLTCLFWAGNTVAGKFAVGHVSPQALTFLRWGLALCIIGFIARKQLQKDWAVLRPRWVYWLLMGGIGFTGFNTSLYTAVQYTSPINVSIVQTSMPLFIFFINFLVFQIRFKAAQIAGYFLTVIGVLVTVTNGHLSQIFTSGDIGFNRGDLIMLAGAIIYAGYSVGLRSMPKVHWQSSLAAFISGGVVFAIVGAAYETWAGHAVWPTTTQGFAVVAYTAIFPSLISQGFFIAGVTAIGANRAGVFMNIIPIFTAIMSVIMLGENLHPYHAIAFALVVGGVMIAQRASRAEAKTET